MDREHDSKREGVGAESAVPRVAGGFEPLDVTASRLFELLWPGASSNEIAAALNGRVSGAHIRMFRTGARRLPQWLRDLAETRAADIGATLKATPAPLGSQAGWRNVSGYTSNR